MEGSAAIENKGFALKKGGSCIVMYTNNQWTTIKGDLSQVNEFTPSDKLSYFDDQLLVLHYGTHINEQAIGAPLPAIPQSKAALNFEPAASMRWYQSYPDSYNLSHATKRKSEKTIMGETARDALERAGLRPQPFSCWAHTKPDHVNFIDRHDKELRIPSYQAANQVHSSFEIAAKKFSRKYGGIYVSRDMGVSISGGSGLPSTLTLGLGLPGKNGLIHQFSHTQPYFSFTGARNGDEVAIYKFLEKKRELIDNSLPSGASRVVNMDEYLSNPQKPGEKLKLISVAHDHDIYIANILLELAAENSDKSTDRTSGEQVSSTNESVSDDSFDKLDERERDSSRGM